MASAIRDRVLLLPLGLLAACQLAGQPRLTVRVDGQTRSYLEFVPDSLDRQQPAPLLLVFHGGAGHAARSRSFGFEPVAERHGMLLAYPEAIDGHWNDGRGGAAFATHDAEVDDVAYAMAVIADMRRRHRVDPTRIYAAGASNGGMFVQRLAAEHAEVFAAVASWIASLPEPLARHFAPSQPLPVLFICGTEDPLVPYAGGEVVVNLWPRLRRRPPPSRGRVLGVEAAAQLWARHNGIDEPPQIALAPDIDKRDGCHAEIHRWRAAAAGGAEVVLYKIIGGGHTLPGGRQYLPVKRIGRTCRDFDAAQVTWRFLERHRRKRGNAPRPPAATPVIPATTATSAAANSR